MFELLFFHREYTLKTPLVQLMRECSHRAITFYVLLVAIFVCGSFPSCAKATRLPSVVQWPYSANQRIQLLDWSKSSISMCGIYHEPAFITSIKEKIPAYATATTYVSSAGPTLLREHGVSILEKDVIVKQKGRRIYADKAKVIRDQNSGRIISIYLTGHVRSYEKDRFVTAQNALLNFQDNTLKMHHVLYRMHLPSPQGNSNAWGESNNYNGKGSYLVTLQHANYTTCSPHHPFWRMYARKFKLNKRTNQGTAKNVVLHIMKIPVFYTPYFSFPLKKKRKTGLLAPTLGHSSESGYFVGLPFYWNMAPNYDDTLTTTEYSKRGLGFNNVFRYINHRTSAHITTDILPDDRAFSSLRKNILANPVYLTPFYSPYIKQLQQDSSTRYAVSMAQQTAWTSHLLSSLNINYASDAYYFDDFGYDSYQTQYNQLNNQALISYSHPHWNITSYVQLFETLHDIGRDPVLDQYQRLPEIDFSAYYPNLLPHIDFADDSEFSNFQFDSVFESKPVGQRYHSHPKLSLNWYGSWWSSSPSIALDMTAYDLSKVNAPYKNDANRILPVVDWDNKAIFYQNNFFHNHSYLAKLQPEVSYVYVPYESQQNIPVFDSSLAQWSYDQLFSWNSFLGFDRIQNSNRINFGIQGSLAHADTGNNFVSLGVGTQYNFSLPRVNILKENIYHLPWSPLVLTGSWEPWTHWSFSWNGAVNMYDGKFYNSIVNGYYRADNNAIFGLGYEFIGQQTMNMVNYDQLRVYGSWPFTQKIQGLGYFYYDFQKNTIQEYYSGVQFSTCGWALRLIADRIYNETQIRGKNYENRYYIQLQLTGLSQIGQVGGSSLLKYTIPGYVDQFRST